LCSGRQSGQNEGQNENNIKLIRSCSSLENCESVSGGKYKVANFSYKGRVDEYLFAQPDIIGTSVQLAMYHEVLKKKMWGG
jgi:hypothetical protein